MPVTVLTGYLETDRAFPFFSFFRIDIAPGFETLRSSQFDFPSVGGFRHVSFRLHLGNRVETFNGFRFSFRRLPVIKIMRRLHGNLSVIFGFKKCGIRCFFKVKIKIPRQIDFSALFRPYSGISTRSAHLRFKRQRFIFFIRFL